MAVVEFAPYQKVPNEKKKPDARIGTIEKGTSISSGRFYLIVTRRGLYIFYRDVEPAYRTSYSRAALYVHSSYHPRHF